MTEFELIAEFLLHLQGNEKGLACRSSTAPFFEIGNSNGYFVHYHHLPEHPRQLRIKDTSGFDRTYTLVTDDTLDLLCRSISVKIVVLEADNYYTSPTLRVELIATNLVNAINDFKGKIERLAEGQD